MKIPTPIERRRRRTVPWNLLGAPAPLPASSFDCNTPARVPALPAGIRAFTIIECLVYIGLFAVLLGLGTVAFYRCFDNMKGLRRNADDITRALHAGEQWRADVRMANAEQQLETGDEPILHLPNKQGEIVYRFSTGAVFRKTGSGPWTCVLTNVKSSGIIFDVRTRVTAWCWELELKPTQKNVRMRPLFTFLAVPENGKQP